MKSSGRLCSVVERAGSTSGTRPSERNQGFEGTWNAIGCSDPTGSREISNLNLQHTTWNVKPEKWSLELGA